MLTTVIICAIIGVLIFLITEIRISISFNICTSVGDFITILFSCTLVSAIMGVFAYEAWQLLAWTFSFVTLLGLAIILSVIAVAVTEMLFFRGIFKYTVGYMPVIAILTALFIAIASFGITTLSVLSIAELLHRLGWIH